MQNFSWVQCDACEKWRILIGELSDEDLPDKWYCKDNREDPVNNTCKASEKPQIWYENFLRGGLDENVTSSPVKKARDSARSARAPKQSHNDPLLQHLTLITEEEKNTTLVCQHYFHDALLETTDAGEELERVQKEMSERIEEEKKSEQNVASDTGTYSCFNIGTTFFFLTSNIVSFSFVHQQLLRKMAVTHKWKCLAKPSLRLPSQVFQRRCPRLQR